MKKKIVSLALVVALIAIAAMGTLAYFTDIDDAANVFTVGSVDIELTEATVDYNEDNATWEANEERTTEGVTYEGAVYPGAVLPKDPTVENKGINNAYIRAYVYFDYGYMTYLMDGLEGRDRYESYVDYVQTFIGSEYGEGWSLKDVTIGLTPGETSGANTTFVAEFTYDRVLESGETTDPIFTQVTIPAEFDNEDLNWLNNVPAEYENKGMRIDVVVNAIQAEGFDSAEEAWNAYDAQ